MRFLLKRLAGAAVVLLIVAVLVFLLTQLASGDPMALLLGDQATAADIAKARTQYGLDQPLPAQFVLWFGELLQGNLGQSIFLQRPVAQALLERAEPTLFLALFAVAIAALIGIPCGMAAAIWRGRAADQALSGVAMLGASIPSIWMGLTTALMIGGTVVTETVFNLPGVGNLVVRAVLRRDYPVIQGTLLVIAGIYVLINLVIDLLYTLVDPRIRLESA